jgi:hypothetical protein
MNRVLNRQKDSETNQFDIDMIKNLIDHIEEKMLVQVKKKIVTSLTEETRKHYSNILQL